MNPRDFVRNFIASTLLLFTLVAWFCGEFGAPSSRALVPKGGRDASSAREENATFATLDAREDERARESTRDLRVVSSREFQIAKRRAETRRGSDNLVRSTSTRAAFGRDGFGVFLFRHFLSSRVARPSLYLLLSVLLN